MSGELQPGERFLDRYRIEGLVAEGGMASIYLAIDDVANRQVAVKTLYPYYGENRIIRARFLEEGRIQQILGHPNIVHVYKIVEKPRLAIVMEYVDGPTLDDYLGERGPLPEKDILDIIIPVMSAVGFAHSKGIIHRDLKPSNVLIPQQGEVLVPKVMDFGVAKVKGGKHDLTATGTTVGTLHYMSPEQIVGSKSIDGRADIYSLGVTLYKLATGEVPFNAPTEFALMMAQVEAPPLPPRKLRAELSPEFEEIILKAMEKKPQKRFQTIRAFTTALLNMSLESSTKSARDTITESIPSEILEFAMAADEVAQDRTGEMNLRVVSEETINKLERASAGAPSSELEDTLKMRSYGDAPARTDHTAELRASQIIKMDELDDVTNEDLFVHDAATLPTKILNRDRLERQPDRTTNPTRPSRPSARRSASQAGRLGSNEGGEARPGSDYHNQAPRPTSDHYAGAASSPSDRYPGARPRSERGPGGRLRPEHNPPLSARPTSDRYAPSTRSHASHDRPRSSTDHPRSIESSDDGRTSSDARRGGVSPIDDQANSRDMTAPKIENGRINNILIGRSRSRTGVDSQDRRPEGPKVVLGFNPADTQERTYEKPNYHEKIEHLTARGGEVESTGLLPPGRGDGRREPSGAARSEAPPTESGEGRYGIQNFSGGARSPTNQRASPWLVAAGFAAILIIVVSLVVLIGWFFLGIKP